MAVAARLIACGLALPVLAVLASCSSWDTGSASGYEAERACLDTLEAFARAEERCGAEYETAYDDLLAKNANGDCKNVRTIRDEASLRKTCIPFLKTQTCADLENGVLDPSCAAQLERPL